MNRAAFRRFEFFDFDSISQNLSSALGGIATCAVAESGLLIFGDELGNIIFADREMKVSDKKYKVYNGEVISLAYIFDSQNSNKQYIICIGDDSRPSFDPTESFSSANAPSRAINVIKLFSVQDMVHPLQVVNATIDNAIVTAFAVQSEGLEVAVGYSNGRVLLFTNILSNREGQTRPGPPTQLLQQHFAPVSSLHFCDPRVQKSSELRRIKLFVVMETKDSALATSTDDQPLLELDQDDIEHAGIMVFDTSLMQTPGNRGGFVVTPRQPPRALDERGATRFNASYFKGTGELVVARNEAIYTYTVEDKGGAVAIFGDKVGVHTVGRYTLVLSVDDKQPAAAPTTAPVTIPAAGGVGVGGGGGIGEKPRKTAMNMYDMKNRFVCGTAKKQFIPANDRLAFLFSDSGVVYVVTANGLLLRYREKDVASKLHVLLEQASPPLYSLAITLAMEEQLEAAEIMKLYQQYGDHLYAKQEYEAAISQYCQTIGHLPPSYVIIKFLDPYRIENLITYLEKIRDKNMAAANHITLLLNCYAKVKDEAKINSLLESVYEKARGSAAASAAMTATASASSTASASNPLQLVGSFRQQQDVGNLPPIFDPAAAVTALQAAGYLDQALRTAIRYRLHETYMTLQLVEKNPPLVDEALGYLAYMALTSSSSGQIPPFAAAAAATGSFAGLEEVVSVLQSFGSTLLALRPRAFTNLMIKLCTGTLDSLISAAAMAPSPVPRGSKEVTSEVQQIAAFMRTLQALLEHRPSTYTAAVSREFPVQEVLPVLADDAEHLLLFLEGITGYSSAALSASAAVSSSSSAGQRLLPAKAWMTLLELYLSQWQKLSGSAAEDMSVRIMSILDGASVSYDAAHVLLLCHIHGYDKGQRYLLERQNYVELVLLQLMTATTTTTTNAAGKSGSQQRERELFKLLRREGSKDPELFLQVLTYLVNQTISADDGKGVKTGGEKGKAMRPAMQGADEDEEMFKDLRPADEDDDSKWDVIVDLVDLISKESILSPIQVMSALAINPRLPLHIVADYVQSTFRELSDSVGSMEADVKEAKRRLDQVPSSSYAEIEARRTAKREQRAATRKASSRYDGYDEEEDDDDEEEAQQAARLEQEKWVSIRKAQVECSQDHEAFYKELELSADGFSTVAGFFGRSLIFY